MPFQWEWEERIWFLFFSISKALASTSSLVTFNRNEFDTSNLFRYLVFMLTKAEKPTSHKYEVVKGKSTFIASSNKQGWLSATESQNFVNSLRLKVFFSEVSSDKSITLHLLLLTFQLVCCLEMGYKSSYSCRTSSSFPGSRRQNYFSTVLNDWKSQILHWHLAVIRFL